MVLFIFLILSCHVVHSGTCNLSAPTGKNVVNFKWMDARGLQGYIGIWNDLPSRELNRSHLGKKRNHRLKSANRDGNMLVARAGCFLSLPEFLKCSMARSKDVLFIIWLVVSTPLKNIRHNKKQNWKSSPGVKIKDIIINSWNHYPVFHLSNDFGNFKGLFSVHPFWDP